MNQAFKPLQFVNDNPEYHRLIEATANRHGFTCTPEQLRHIAGQLIAEGVDITGCDADGVTDNLWDCMTTYAGVQE